MIKGITFIKKPDEQREHTNPETGEVFRWTTQQHNWLGWDRVTILEVRQSSTVTYKCQPCGHIDWETKSKNTATKHRIEYEYICLTDGILTTVDEDDMFSCLINDSMYECMPPTDPHTDAMLFMAHRGSQGTINVN